MRSKSFSTIMRVGVFGIFLLILARLVDVQTLREAFPLINIAILGGAVPLYFLNMAIRAYRWKIIINHQDKKFSFKDAYIVTFIGATLNLFLPASLGDIAKSYYGYKIYGFKEDVLVTSVIDKMFALCALFVLGAVSASLMNYRILATFSGGMAVVTGVFLGNPRYIPWNMLNRILSLLKKSLDVPKLLGASVFSPGLKIVLFGISVGAWLFNACYFYILCSAFPVNVSLNYVVLIMPLLLLVRLFPFTINSIGPKEVVLVYLFGIIGVNSTVSVMISLTSNLISSVIPGSIGLLLLLTLKRKKERQL
jgi:uncharacterized membrane protein YbhN (UPF0104 family)